MSEAGVSVKDKEFDLSEFGTSFSVKSPSVREQLMFYDRIGETFEERWEATKLLLRNWQSEVLPDINADLGEVEDWRVSELILQTITKASAYINSMRGVPKNE